jgi:transcriptional regulator with XRE-family HTH domain
MADYRELSLIIKRALGDRSQEWLQEKSGVSQSTISRLLRGTHATSARNIAIIAETLGLDPNVLFQVAGITGNASLKPLDPTARYIAQRITDLPPAIRETAKQVVGDVVDGLWILADTMESEAQRLIEEHGVLTGDENAVRRLKILKHRDPELYDEIMQDLEPPP